MSEIAAIAVFGGLMFFIGTQWGSMREFRRETARQRKAFERSKAKA